MKREIGDREFYPAVWITIIILVVAYLIWKVVLGQPTISNCWIWQNWHVYCPGCGGTRSLLALLRGDVLASVYYHPALPILLGVLGVYMLSQTIWRLRGRQGWVLRYRTWWAPCMVWILLGNCLLRNILLSAFEISIS